MIELNNITKIYGEGESKTIALNSVNLTMEEGEFVGIMGPSGSGKSTLLNILGCIDSPSNGIYTLNGKDVSRLKKRELSRVRNEEIGFIFQNFNLLYDFNRSYKAGNIPVLIGGGFKEIYKIGDIIKKSELIKESSDEDDERVVEINLEVVGTVKDETVLTTNWNHDKFMESADLSESTIIVPITKDITRFSLNWVIYDSSSQLSGPILKLNNNVDRKVLENRLSELLSEIKGDDIDLTFKLVPMSSNDEVMKSLYSDSTKTIIIGITIIILSIMGLIIIILGEVNKRKREFGIKLAVGATIKDISKELIKEIFTLTCCSTIISFCFMYLVIGAINLKLSFLLANLFLIIGLTILISIIPILEIKKLKVIELIRIQK